MSNGAFLVHTLKSRNIHTYVGVSLLTYGTVNCVTEWSSLKINTNTVDINVGMLT